MGDSAVFIDAVKLRMGLSPQIDEFDNNIIMMIEDAIHDLVASGVPKSFIHTDMPPVVTAITLYCMAMSPDLTYVGGGVTSADKYMQMYREKVARLALEEGE